MVVSCIGAQELHTDNGSVMPPSGYTCNTDSVPRMDRHWLQGIYNPLDTACTRSVLVALRGLLAYALLLRRSIIHYMYAFGLRFQVKVVASFLGTTCYL